MAKKPIRKKVHKALLERQLYKLERRIQRFASEAYNLRQAISLMDAQEKQPIVQASDDSVLLQAGIESAALNTEGGEDNASNT